MEFIDTQILSLDQFPVFLMSCTEFIQNERCFNHNGVRQNKLVTLDLI